MTEMGRYMDISVQPARKVSEESVVAQTFNNSRALFKLNLHIFSTSISGHSYSGYVCMFFFFFQICLKEVMLSKEEVEDRPLSGTVRVIRVDSFYSSDTSCDSSPVSSDLEVGWAT